MSESHTIEYKRELTDDFEKEVVAFLNAKEGGKVFIGIEDDGTVVGVQNPDQLMLTIKNRIKDRIQPATLGLFDIIKEVKNGLDTIKIILGSGTDKPYYIKKYGLSVKGCFVRVGTAAEPMSQELIDQFYSTKTRQSLAKIVSDEQALTFEQLKIYYQERGIALNQQFAKNLELKVQSGKYNYVAYLLADQNGNSVKVASYNGVDRIDLRENPELGYVSLIKAAKAVLEKLEIENKYLTKVTPGAREDQRLWHAQALKEAVLNAFIHNDYTNEVPVKFEIFDDRIEITSSGGLPSGINQEEFFEGYTVPRNRQLIRIFKDLGLVEQLGSGVPRILGAYNRDCFKFSQNFVRVTLPKAIDSKATDTTDNGTGIIGGTMGGIIGGTITDRQKEVLQLIVANNRISITKLAEGLGINRSAVQGHIDALREKGILEREGGTRGYWKILKGL